MKPWVASAVLATAVVVAYWNSLSAPFIFDDNVAVVGNPTIRAIGWAALNPPANGGTTTGRPVVNLSYAFDYALSGQQVWSYHATNIAIHALAALVLFGLMRRTLRLRPAGWDGALWPDRRSVDLGAFFAAALWALHPLQTETVVGIAQRTESLCGLFYLLTLYAFVRAVVDGPDQPTGGGPAAVRRRVERSFGGWRWVAWTACLLGMATKEVMVTAPVIVLLYDRTFLAGSFRAALRLRRWWYAALAATWVLLAVLVVHSGGARGASAGFGRGLGVWPYLLTQCKAILLYVKLACWPHPLVLDYGSGVVTRIGDVAVQGAVVLAALAGTIWALVRKPVLGFATATFFILLAPSSSFVPLVTQTMAEHRMYLAVAVFTSAFTLAVVRCSPRPAWLLVMLALTFGGMTMARNAVYRDPITIWTDNVAKRPQGERGHNNLALALQAKGRVDDADTEFGRAIALDPTYVTARYDYGVSLLQRGRIDGAIEQLSAVVKLAPDHADAQVNLGNALMRADRPAEALPHYEAALRVSPESDVHYDLGMALLALHRDATAAQQFQAAVAAQPALAAAHLQLARLADDSGDTAAAEREYTQTLLYAPDNAVAHAGLGFLLARANRLPAAEEHLRSAVRLAPDDVDARANLGNVLLLQGRAQDAIACYEEVLRRRPNDSRARENLELARSALR